jgi:AAA domain
MTWQAINLAAPEFAQPTEPPITGGLIYRGRRHALSGAPEAAKTLAALILGLEHYRAGHGRFALIDFEMGEHASRLLLADLGATLEEIAAVYYVAPDGPPDDIDVDAIAAAGVTLVIIDAAAGAYEASELDDNKRADAEKFSRAWVHPLWERGIATILIDHVVKNADNRGRYAIGSERKLGSVDVHLGLHAVKQLHRGADGLIVVSTHKDRPGHLRRPRAAELELRSDPDSHRIGWTFRASEAGEGETGWMPTVLMERVSAYLATLSDPVSRKQIEQNVQGATDYKRQAIDALLAGGYATESKGPHGARLVANAHLYTTSPNLASTSPGEDAHYLASSPPTTSRSEAGAASSATSTSPTENGHIYDAHHDAVYADELEQPPPLIDDYLALEDHRQFADLLKDESAA